MEKEEVLKLIMELPKVETNNSISTMYGINVDDLMCAIDRLNKAPTYDELLRENKKQREIIDKTKKIIGEELLTYDNESDEYLVGLKLLQTLEDKEV